MNRIQYNFTVFIFSILCSFLLVISGGVDASGETENLSDQAEVVWPELRSGNFDIYYSRLTASGWTEKTPLSDSAETDMMPCFCSGSDGLRWVAWTVDSGLKSDLLYCYFENGEWTDPKKIVTGLLLNAAPAIIVDQENKPWIVWTGSNGNGKGSDIFFSRWNGHDWDQPLRVNKADSMPDIMPLIGRDSAGVPWVSWFGFDGTRYRPYSCKWSSRGWGDEIESDSDNLYEVLIQTGNKGGIPTLPAFIKVKEQEKACVYVRNRGQLQSFPIRYLGLGDLLRTAAPSGPRVMEEMRSPDGLVLLCFGDSITQGYPYIPDPGDGRRVGGYEPELERLLSADLRATQAFNWGVGGEKTFDGVNRINSVLSNPHADSILILEGTNDFWHIGWEDTIINLGLMIDKSLAQNIAPILSTLTPDTSLTGIAKQINTTYNPAIRDLAAEKGVILADQYAGLIGGWPSPYADGEGDGLHPNAVGYKAMAQIWYSVIPEPPTVTTTAAGPIGFTTAVLNGTVNPNGVSTQYYFEYGKTTSYGSATTGINAGSGKGVSAVNDSVTGLVGDTLYHFRIVATSSAGTSYGDDLTFTTHIFSCDGCEGDIVILKNVVFQTGTECECVAGTSITIEDVTIESGADVRFRAPEVNIVKPFIAEIGSSVSIKQN